MKLSIFVPTRNGSTRNPPGTFVQLLERLSNLADELVVEVDDRTTDDTFDVARQFTEHVHYFRPDPMFVEISRLSFYRCTGDWIFLFDDDDTLSERWTRDAVEHLMRQRAVTHYWIPARFAVDDKGTYLATAPYIGHFHLSLYRNIESLMSLPTKLHEQPAFAGEPAYLGGMFVNAMDFAWHDRTFREAKIDTYAEAYDEAGTEFDQTRFYLYEDYYFETIVMDDAAVRKVMAPSVESAPGLHVRIIDCPEIMTAGQTYWATVRITNNTQRTLLPQSELIRWGELALSYRWYAETPAPGNILQTPFPARLPPGHEHDALLKVEAPKLPARYVLRPGVLEHGAVWLSQTDVTDEREAHRIQVEPLMWPPRLQ